MGAAVDLCEDSIGLHTYIHNSRSGLNQILTIFNVPSPQAIMQVSYIRNSRKYVQYK